MAERRVYLDYNASAPLLPAARAAMLAALDADANPSSVHEEGRAARHLIEVARREVASLAGGDAKGVVFTSGATEAASMLLQPGWTMGRAPLTFSHLYVLASDHPCLLGGGHFELSHVTQIAVDRNGIADLAALSHALENHDVETGLPLIAMHLVNNETGVIQPVPQIADCVSRAGGMLVLDAAQAAGRIPLDISELCADFLILSGHKIGGPRGVGALVAKSTLMMPRPLVRGGGQERGHRGGTENVSGIAGFGAAAKEARTRLGEMTRVTALRDHLEAEIAKIAPDVVIHGKGAPRIGNTSFFSVPGIKAETAQIALDLAGIAASSGSACSSGKVGPSHVLAAMGNDARAGALRLSFGHGTNEEEVTRCVEALRDSVARRDAKAAAA